MSSPSIALPSIALVVAVAADGTIGRAGGLPWHLPEDLAWFRQVTWGKAMVMGRRTWDSIGRPLPGRDSVVVTGDPGWRAEGAHAVPSLEDGLALAARLRPGADEIAVIGGAMLFAAALPLADRLYWTDVKGHWPGDTHFPPFDRAAWRETWSEERDRVRFAILERRPPPGAGEGHADLTRS